MTTDLSLYNANELPSADVLKRQRYAIVVADWNSVITHALAQGAIDTLIKHGVNIVIYANQLLRAAFPAMQNAAKLILESHRAKECDEICMPSSFSLM